MIFFFFKILVHFYRFKSQLTQKIANYRKFPLEWLILSTKMIQKWPPFAYTCLYKKKWTKNWQIPLQCSESHPSNDYQNPGIIFKNHFCQCVADCNQSNNAGHHIKQVDCISQKVVKTIIGFFDCQCANDCNRDQDQ